MGRVARRRLEGFGDHAFHYATRNPPRRPRTRLIEQTREPRAMKSAHPFADRRPMDAQVPGNVHVRALTRTRQHDPGAQRQPCVVDRRRTQCSSVARSPGLTIRRELGRPHRFAIGASLYLKYERRRYFVAEFLTQDTRTGSYLDSVDRFERLNPQDGSQSSSTWHRRCLRSVECERDLPPLRNPPRP